MDAIKANLLECHTLHDENLKLLHKLDALHEQCKSRLNSLTHQ